MRNKGRSGLWRILYVRHALKISRLDRRALLDRIHTVGNLSRRVAIFTVRLLQDAGQIAEATNPAVSHTDVESFLGHDFGTLLRLRSSPGDLSSEHAVTHYSLTIRSLLGLKTQWFISCLHVKAVYIVHSRCTC